MNKHNLTFYLGCFYALVLVAFAVISAFQPNGLFRAALCLGAAVIVALVLFSHPRR